MKMLKDMINNRLNKRNSLEIILKQLIEFINVVAASSRWVCTG